MIPAACIESHIREKFSSDDPAKPGPRVLLKQNQSRPPAAQALRSPAPTARNISAFIKPHFAARA
jgi:hypothetical protein